MHYSAPKLIIHKHPEAGILQYAFELADLKG